VRTLANIDDNIFFQVVVTGRPMPELTWYLDDQPITTNDEITIVMEKGHSVLTVMEVLPDDEGEYRVEAVNKVGSCTSVAYITVTREYSGFLFVWCWVSFHQYCLYLSSVPLWGFIGCRYFYLASNLSIFFSIGVLYLSSSFG
jgi:hypothetical protein